MPVCLTEAHRSHYRSRCSCWYPNALARLAKLLLSADSIAASDSVAPITIPTSAVAIAGALLMPFLIIGPQRITHARRPATYAALLAIATAESEAARADVDRERPG